MLTSFNFTTHLQDFLQIGIIATVISSLTHKETKLATNLSPNENVNENDARAGLLSETSKKGPRQETGFGNRGYE